MLMPSLAEPRWTGPVAVVGAGLSGLCCAAHLHQAGAPVVVLERAHRVGGRVVTDERDGFLLDRGFQVLLTSYPEVRAMLDLDALGLAAFRPGSAVRLDDRTCTISDPFREPWTAVKALTTPLLSVSDALRSFTLRRRLLKGCPPTGRAHDVLAASGISEDLLARFYRPFFQGVTLDPALGVPSDYFAFLFRMFARGAATLPRSGMGAVPQQLADRLPAGSVRLGAAVEAVGPDHVTLEGGDRLAASQVVVAVEGRSAAALVDVAPPAADRSTTCVYFAVAGPPPCEQRMLTLNGAGAGNLLHMCVPSVVQPSYAPDGQHLVSVTLLGVHGDEVAASVLDELRLWFGDDVTSWRHLHTATVAHALPALDTDQPVMQRSGARRLESDVVACGDYLATPSIQGAMAAGRRAAELVLEGAAQATA